MNYQIGIDGKIYRLEVERSEGQWRCRLDGRPVNINAVLARPNVLSVLLHGKAYEIKRELTATDLHLWVGSLRYAVEIHDPRSLKYRKSGGAASQGLEKLVVPMPGRVVRVLVHEGVQIEAGQGVLVVEAMKMQNEIKSAKAGVVQKINVVEGEAVNAGDVVAVVE
jgi:acetyl/propionyl-CoA carboxylase alpha subunit